MSYRILCRSKTLYSIRKAVKFCKYLLPPHHCLFHTHVCMYLSHTYVLIILYNVKIPRYLFVLGEDKGEVSIEKTGAFKPFQKTAVIILDEVSVSQAKQKCGRYLGFRLRTQSLKKTYCNPDGAYTFSLRFKYFVLYYPDLDYNQQRPRRYESHRLKQVYVQNITVFFRERVA